jgi:hypothetical protein
MDHLQVPLRLRRVPPVARSVEDAHDNGGSRVEGENCRSRPTLPAPCRWPSRGRVVAELDTRLEGYDTRDDRHRVGHRTSSVRSDVTPRNQTLPPLPGEEFRTGLTMFPQVD